MTTDEELVRRAGRRVALVVGLAVATALLVIGTAVWVVAHREVDEHRGRADESAAEQVGDVDSGLAVGALALLGVAVAGGVGVVAARTAVRPLATALAAQRRFVADASHELRTPVAVVSTRAGLLQRRLASDDPARAAVDELVEDARVLGDVVADLLVAQLVDRGPLPTEPVDLGALARRAASAVAVLAAERGVTVEALAPTDPVVVHASPVALRRAVTGLVDNACSHAAHHVRVEVATSSGRAVVTVADDGGGFPADTSRLTERFHRSASDDGQARFGLGLALVADVARAHGGTLTLANDPQGGARARLEIPAER